MVAEGDVLGRAVVAVEQERIADVKDAVVHVQFRPPDAVGRVPLVAGHFPAPAHVGAAPAERAVADHRAGHGAERVSRTEAGRDVLVHVRRHPQPAAPAVLFLMAVRIAADRVQAANQVHRIAAPAEPVRDRGLAAGVRADVERVVRGVVPAGPLDQIVSRCDRPQCGIQTNCSVSWFG